MPSITEQVKERGGQSEHVAIYGAFLRAGQREPADFEFVGPGTIDFTVSDQNTALAILEPSENEAAILSLEAAALESFGVRLEIITSSEAIRSPDRIVERLVSGGI